MLLCVYPLALALLLIFVVVIVCISPPLFLYLMLLLITFVNTVPITILYSSEPEPTYGYRDQKPSRLAIMQTADRVVNVVSNCGMIAPIHQVMARYVITYISQPNDQSL